jgi:hypothetical protein
MTKIAFFKSFVKKRTTCAATLFFSLMALPCQPSERFELHFFGSPTCGECLHIKKSILFPAGKDHPEIDLRIHDIGTDTGFNDLMRMEEDYGVAASSAIELFFPDTFLTGAQAILDNAPRLIQRYLENPGLWRARAVFCRDTAFSGKLAGKFRSFSFVSILAAGIIDGINPCAIATMIFLVSFLAVQKRKRSEILAIGLSFTAAVFVTYLALGIGAFKALTFLQKYSWVSAAIRWGAVVMAAGVGIYSFRDAIIYRTTGKAQDLKLQLPKTVKLRIHKVISGNLSGTSLAFGAIVTGFLVTLLEAVCTGQVYLPTIVLMTKQEGLKFIGWIYLVFYNFLFISPLLIVMVLAYFGLRWDQLAKMTQKNLAMIKVLFGVVLCGLAVFLAVAA